GQTPLHLAAESGRTEVAQRLVELGADLKAKNRLGSTPWDHAQTWGKQEAMAPILRPVHVALLSGLSVPCGHWPERHVNELLEEAKQKLGVEIRELITNTGKPLKVQLTLEEAGVNIGDFVTALVMVPEDPVEHPAQSVQGGVARPEGPPGEVQMSDPEETIRFPNNITLVAPKSVWNQHALMADIVDWNASDVPSTESLFTDGEEPLSPLVRLTPEHTSFTTPVTVMFPACIGATRVWRSSESSWELVELESFENGCVTTSLSHFCHCFASGNSRILKAIGYIKPHSAVAKLALACVGRCHQCNHALEQYQEDYYFLEGYQPCTRPAPVGTCEDTTSFRVTQGAHQQTLQVSSRMCPAISDELQAQGTQFKVQIEDIEHTFKCDAATHGDVTISGASSSSQQRPSSSEPLGDVTQPSSATMSSYFASFLPSFLL
ncbi:Mannitol 2-dehydrogenase, partial [Durusdinium trenchii]